jgi:hypothetical protein
MATTDDVPRAMSAAELVQECHNATRQQSHERAMAAREADTQAAYVAIVQVVAMLAKTVDHRDPSLVVCKHAFPHADVDMLQKRLQEQGFSVRLGTYADDRTCVNTALVGVGVMCKRAIDASRDTAIVGGRTDVDTDGTSECATVVVQNTWVAVYDAACN